MSLYDITLKYGNDPNILKSQIGMYLSGLERIVVNELLEISKISKALEQVKNLRFIFTTLVKNGDGNIRNVVSNVVEHLVRQQQNIINVIERIRSSKREAYFSEFYKFEYFLTIVIGHVLYHKYCKENRYDFENPEELKLRSYLETYKVLESFLDILSRYHNIGILPKYLAIIYVSNSGRIFEISPSEVFKVAYYRKKDGIGVAINLNKEPYLLCLGNETCILLTTGKPELRIPVHIVNSLYLSAPCSSIRIRS